jgi:hypothetical protein
MPETVTRDSADIDREQVPEPYNTFERPWVYRTYIIPEDSLCERPGCFCVAHVGLMEMDAANLEIWETQEGEITGEMSYWCAMDYAQALEQPVPEPAPVTESEPREMTEEEMMETWEEDDG